MIIKSLHIANFRNFDHIQTDFSEHVNIFLGDNGQGKTNLLEAIYLLIDGESFRYTKYETLVKLDKSEGLIKSHLENEKLDYNLKLLFSGHKKEFTVNEKKSSHSNLNLPPAILFSPESLSIIKESSDERRSLADQLVIQSNRQGRRVIQDFKKALKTRNKILKDLAHEQIDREIGIETLASLNQIYLKLAAEVTILRLNALTDIQNDVEKALVQIHAGQNIKFDYKYIISDIDHKNSDLELVIKSLQNRMKELEKFELQSGVSLVGPQKHDVIFLYNGNDSRFYSSQGQQRSIILAFKMAQIVYHHRVHGFYPVLLLDDVLSELDLSKQESLISTLNQTKTQTFVTTTDVSLISKLSLSNTRVFNIKNGQIFS
ncbi:MAG: DNA replication and repair protein RecF [Bdellovibrionaceae bacterium]|nr:DNA replication and repair protein RecF [Bdellovibrio sp.]